MKNQLLSKIMSMNIDSSKYYFFYGNMIPDELIIGVSDADFAAFVVIMKQQTTIVTTLGKDTLNLITNRLLLIGDRLL
jgi:hypothetical protein